MAGYGQGGYGQGGYGGGTGGTMSDVVGTIIEVGENSGGPASLQQWISQQVTAGTTNIIGTATYAENDKNYVVIAMATILAKAASAAIGSFVASSVFDIRNGISNVINWLNTQEAGILAPAAPSLSQITAGALTGQGTLSVRVTLASPYGESLPSTNSTLAVNNNNELVVASPVKDVNGFATGWNVYIGTAGSEKKQNTTPIAFGTSYTLTTAPNTTNAAVPTTNASGAKYVQQFNLTKRGRYSQLLVVTVSN